MPEALLERSPKLKMRSYPGSGRPLSDRHWVLR